METPFSKEAPVIGRLPIHIDEDEGNITVMSRVYLAPHAEEEGDIAPKREILASLQGIPQDIICGDQGTTHDLHVPLMIGCKNMEMKGGDREDDHHHVIRRTHPYLFQEVDAPKRETRLRSEGKDKSVHPYMQSTLDDDVSLNGGISLGSPLDQQMMRDALHLEALLIDFRGVETFGELGTVLGVLGRLKEERGILSTSSLPTLISDFVLWKEKHGRDRSLPTCIFGMGGVKEEDDHMTYVLYDRSSTLSLWRIDPYWNS